jgi:glycosyltransferase involved in cell wall biosynthesis
MGAILHMLEQPVPPTKTSGGLNRLVEWLATEQGKQGHKVYVAAPGGESTRYFEHIRIPRDYSPDSIAPLMPTDVTDVEMHQVRPDVAAWVLGHYPRSIQIMHSGISPAEANSEHWAGTRTVFVSRNHMEQAGGSQFAYNGVPVDDYEFREEKSDNLLFLAKVRRSKKGVQTAIRVAKRCRRKLIVAGGRRNGSPETWFPWHPLIRPIGYVDGRRKTDILSGAAALLVPIRWEEPFGLTVVEAMISGTPVIAFRRGAMPELIVDGVTGFLCDTEDEMVEAVGRLGRLSPADCRQHAVEHFSATAMCRRHMELLALAGSGATW